VQQVTIGRMLLVLVAAGIVVDLAPSRGRVERPAWAVAALMAILGALLAWTILNAATVGCFCGTAQGFGELVVLIGLAGVVGLYASPRWLLVVLGAGTLGVLAGGLLAAVGLKDLHAAVYAASGSADRLDGVYGNPNSLGYALALGLPAACAAIIPRGRTRWAAAAVTAVLLVLLVLTYSRGSLLAAAAGIAAVVLLSPLNRLSRRQTVVAAVALPALVALLFVSPFYKSKRLDADFGGALAQSAADVDRSGWTTAAEGPIAGGGVLTNPPGSDALRLLARRPGQGVAFFLTHAFGDARTEWRLTLTAAGREPADVDWAVKDLRDGTVAQGVAHVRPGTPVRVVARFASRLDHDYATGLWTRSPATLTIDDVQVSEHRPGSPVSTRPISTRLLGSAQRAMSDAEDRFTDSRGAALRMALDAFADYPVQGVGVDQFSRYSLAHEPRYGALPTHDSYAQILAELGLLGLLPLVAAAALLLDVLRRLPPGLGGSPWPRAALLGTIVAGAVNLVFINGLAAPGNAMPLLLAIGFAVALAGEPPSWWRRVSRAAPGRRRARPAA
jgi:O-antigen ligase